MTLADIPVEEVEVWPDSWKAFRLFESLSTQWRTGPGGASGLDYSAIPPRRTWWASNGTNYLASFPTSARWKSKHCS
ncbi:DUF1799 domain-containing protein [Pseudomonas syringae]|uniref:DUF1799 domain-containing protein n=1 Tax=Pseudomonas syringae TaxID=317 RepID=UPI0039659C56